VEGAINDANVAIANVTLSIRPVRSEKRANLIETVGIHGFAVEIAYSKLGAHEFTTAGIG
jgi:hypothetical protein